MSYTYSQKPRAVSLRKSRTTHNNSPRAHWHITDQAQTRAAELLLEHTFPLSAQAANSVRKTLIGEMLISDTTARAAVLRAQAALPEDHPDLCSLEDSETSQLSSEYKRVFEIENETPLYPWRSKMDKFEREFETVLGNDAFMQI
jgi:hypothetical protein